jgi:hypothetical protein
MISHAVGLSAFPVARDRPDDHALDTATTQRRELGRCHTLANQFLVGREQFPEWQDRVESRPFSAAASRRPRSLSAANKRKTPP